VDATEQPTAGYPRKVRVARKLVENAQAHLDGEEVSGVFLGQTLFSPILLPLVGSLLLVAEPRAVIVSRRSVLTVQRSKWSESKVVRVISRHDCGVPVEVGRWGLRIADEDRIFATFSTLEDMREVARLAAQGA
jgi:hypothetical protein